MEVLAVSKSIVVNHEGKILLLRRSETDPRRPNEWDIPGGHVDFGEYPIEAAARETAEEAGIDVDPHDLVLVFAMSEPPREDHSVTWSFYRAQVQNQDIRLSDEHSEYAWVTLDEALERITYERQRRALRYIKDNELLTATVA